MTHFLPRSALILLATSSLSAALCAGPTLAATHHKKAEAPPVAANGKIVAEKGERASYVVKKGDTLAKIADELDTTVAELTSVNGIKKTGVLQPGDVLKGPAVAKKAYVVTKGDTVFSIAKRFHVTVEQLREENDLSTKASIRPGQQIRLPGEYRTPSVEAADDQADKPDKNADKADAEAAKPTKGHKKPPAATSEESPPTGGGTIVTREAKGESYKAKKGDTLAKIADRLDTDVGTLKRLNHVKGSAVHAGQVYRGPSFAEHIYTAQPGYTLASIAVRFGVSVASLRAENERSKRVLSVRSGQKVFLPDGYRDREAPTSAGPPTRSDHGDRAEHYPTVYPPSRGEPALPAHPIPYAPPNGAAATEAPQATAPSISDAQIQQLAKGRFQWPLTGMILSEFGPKPGGQNNAGINIQADTGAPVRASADGEVIYAGNTLPGTGNLVLIRHADGWATVYGNLGRIDVKMQQKVTQGQQVGQAGMSGGVPEPQLHFEVRYQPTEADRARPVNPKLVLPPKP